MLTMPNGKEEALNIYRDLHYLHHYGNAKKWLEDQLSILDIDNRTEIEDAIMKQRQGAAQCIEQLIDFINKANDEVKRLEGLKPERR